VAEPFADKLKRLVRERGTSIARVYDDAPWDTANRGPKPSKASLDQALTGRRPLRLELIELMAAGLDVPPETFEEYQLAKLRAMIDPDVVGFERAVANAAALGGGGLAANGRRRPATPAEAEALIAPPAPLGRRQRASQPRPRQRRRSS
jgi:hypothetical protein